MMTHEPPRLQLQVQLVSTITIPRLHEHFRPHPTPHRDGPVAPESHLIRAESQMPRCTAAAAALALFGTTEALPSVAFPLPPFAANVFLTQRACTRVCEVMQSLFGV